MQFANAKHTRCNYVCMSNQVINGWKMHFAQCALVKKFAEWEKPKVSVAICTWYVCAALLQFFSFPAPFERAEL